MSKSPAHIPLAIIGMGCRLPGVEDLNDFWQLLIDGETRLGELPPERLNQELYYDPNKGQRTKSYTTLGGVVSDRPFDSNCCPIAQEAIDRAHPAHLKFLEVVAAACRQAKLDPFQLAGSKAGVYVGHTPSNALSGNQTYARMIPQTAGWLRELPAFNQLARHDADAIVTDLIGHVRREYSTNDPRFRLRTDAHHVASLIAESFGLNGPVMCFDAACASSLRALGHAARALQFGQIDVAIVGGASYCDGDTLVLFSAAHSVSPSGSRPFDDDADGLVASEGYASLIVKRLDRAIADGDPIQAVVRGVGISSDGKGKSLWAPMVKGQVEAIHHAHGDHLRMADLQYIEMHATSTQVGDATEVSALTEALEGQLPPGRKIPVGSVKAHVGHTLEVAGLAGLIKTVLAIQHGTIPPQINVQRLNSNINWQQAPIEVVLSKRPWDRPSSQQPRRAAVNAFGIGGLNVHVVLDEHLPEASRRLVETPSHELMNRATASAAGRSVPQRDQPLESIAIIGRGTILPGARTIDHLWDVLQSGLDQRSEVPDNRWDAALVYQSAPVRPWSSPTCRGGFIRDFQYDWKKHKVPPKQVQAADPLQFMLLDAADQALNDAGYAQKPFDRKKTGVVVGTIFSGEFGAHLQMGLRLPEFQQLLRQTLRSRGASEEQIAHVAHNFEQLLLQRMPALVDETGSFTASTLASRITKTLDLGGGAVAVDSGEASGFAALSCCLDSLRARDADMMICATGQRAMGAANFISLWHSGKLTSGKVPSIPFDAQTDGMTPGEGVAVLLLKRLSDAERDGDRIHAVIRGLGIARGDDLETAIARAIDESLKSAAINGDAVSVIEAAAKGIPEDDRAELAALRTAYGRRTIPEPILVGSAAAQFGALGGASGTVSLIKAASELQHVQMTPLRGYEQPTEDLGTKLRIPQSSVAVSQSLPNGELFAGVTAYTDFHLAYHVIIERGTRIVNSAAGQSQQTTPVAEANTLPRTATTHPASGTWRIVRAGASTWDELQAEAERLTTSAESCFQAAMAAELINAREMARGFGAGRCRLAIVANSPSDLAAKAALAAKQLAKADARGLLADRGIFVGEVSARPRVAFLFPGQGSQYAGMLRELLAEFPEAEAARQYCDAVMRRLGLPDFQTLAWTEGERLGQDLSRTQFSLLVANTVSYAALQALGIRPDCMAGHSFGELAALVAAEAWTFEDSARATSARCDAIAGCHDARGVMLSTSAPAELIEQCCRIAGGQVYLSHRNAPEQTVAGGEPAAVDRLARLVEEAKHRVKRLDVPAAFHTPLMEPVKVPFAAALAKVPLLPPRVPLLSSVTNRYVADPDEVRHNLVVQMTKPVDYVGLVQRLLADGCTALVEVGPKQVLTGLHRQMTDSRLVTLLSTDHSKRPGLAQLLGVRAGLEVIGALDELLSSGLRFSNQSVTVADAPSEDSVPRARESASSPYEMGLQHGRNKGSQIRAILRRNADLACTSWDQRHNIDDSATQPERFFDEPTLDELRGMAKGANVNAASLIAHNLRLVQSSAGGGLHDAMTDWAAAARLRRNGAARPSVVMDSEELQSAFVAADRRAADSSDTCVRMAVRLVAADPLPDRPLELQGTVLVLGHNAVATAILADLNRRQVRCVQLPAGSLSTMLQAVDTAWQAGPAPHLVICTPHDAEAITSLDQAHWLQRRDAGLLWPYLVCQRWFQQVMNAKLADQASLLAVTAMGGDFGVSSPLRSADGGAIAGLLKAVKMELELSHNMRQFRTKIVDTSVETDPHTLAEHVCREWFTNDGEAEVGWINGQRHVVRPLPLPVSNGHSTSLDLPKSSALVVTGGARGVTAEIARELGRRFGVALHLMGTSPLPNIPEAYHSMSPEELQQTKASVMKEALANGQKPIDAWSQFERSVEVDRNLRGMRAEGLSVTYHACDISDRNAVADVLAKVRVASGPIVGIVRWHRAWGRLRAGQPLREKTTRSGGADVCREARWRDVAAESDSIRSAPFSGGLWLGERTIRRCRPDRLLCGQ